MRARHDAPSDVFGTTEDATESEPLTLDDLRALGARLGPPQWQTTALVLAPDVAAAITAGVVTVHAADPFAGVPVRILDALVPGYAFVEERRAGRVRYRRLLPSTADVCPCACHGDSEEGDPHTEGDCCPDLEDGDREFMAAMGAPLTFEPVEPLGPRNRRAYLAWVRRHAPKRRRFNGPTRRQARAAWITLIADALAAPIAAYMAGEVGAPGLAAALPDEARRFAGLAIEASKIKPPSRMRAFIVDAARRAVTGPAPFRLDPALLNAGGAWVRRILGFGTEGR